MRAKDVPQDQGVQGGLRRVQYAVDAEGAYTLVPSAGCESVNVTNDQAWDFIRREVESAAARVREGEASPLAFHMAVHQMDVGLLHRYARVPRWRIRRHLKPRIFSRLGREILERYALAFGISVEELREPAFPPIRRS